MTTPQNAATPFYDRFVVKLIDDYRHGNTRMLSAIDFMRREVDGCRSVLDIGCGIGWSSRELATLPSVRSVVAVDLSPVLIETARRLFPHPKVRHAVADVTTAFLDDSGTYDAIVMLDVYEHIPRTARAAFHRALDRLLSPTGFVLLTCPTIEHQQYLRRDDPSGLQPVDEDVGLDELANLAESLSATIDSYDVRSVWKPRDYFHAVVRRRAGAPRQERRRRSIVDRLVVKLTGPRR